MRSLQQSDGSYSDAQVVAQLRAGHALLSPRFDVLDNDLNIVGALSTVTAATVEHDVDRRIKGSLTLSMLPDSSMISQFYKRRIRPWLRMSMPDGGVAEWSMGIYPWIRAKRSVGQRGMGTWDITLGDQLMLLDAGGPGYPGFFFYKDTPVRAAVIDVLQRVGITDVSGIADISTTLTSFQAWSLAAAGSWIPGAGAQPTKLLDVVAQLHNGAGVYGPWFDLSGRYRLTTVPDLARAPAQFTYSTTTDGLLRSFTTDSAVDKFANRVIVRTTSAGGFIGTSVADANVLMPDHPANQNAIGIYVDVPIDNSVATTQADLDRQAIAELHQRIAMDEQVTLSTMPNPAHEAFDVIGLQYSGDDEYDSTTRFHERQWAINLFTGAMTHKLMRLYTAVDS